MSYRVLAIAALVCGPALAQAPPLNQTTPLSPSDPPVKTLRSVASGEPTTSERQVFGWTARSLMGAGPTEPVKATDGVGSAVLPSIPIGVPSTRNDTPNGGPN